jgi:hypothetical protein
MDLTALLGDSSSDSTPDATPDSGQYDVPTATIELPNGDQGLVIGDVQGYAAFNHQQGDNSYGYTEDCGLCSASDVLDQFGVNTAENDVVGHAVQHGECDTGESDSTQDGGTSPDQLAQILSDYGVSAHAEQGQSLDDLANEVQQGHGVIIGANAGVLWNDPNSYDQGEANHAVTVTGVVRDPGSGQIEGFYINDSGDGQSAQFVDADTMTSAFVNSGGTAVVTDNTHTEAAGSTGGDPTGGAGGNPLDPTGGTDPLDPTGGAGNPFAPAGGSDPSIGGLVDPTGGADPSISGLVDPTGA